MYKNVIIAIFFLLFFSYENCYEKTNKADLQQTKKPRTEAVRSLFLLFYHSNFFKYPEEFKHLLGLSLHIDLCQRSEGEKVKRGNFILFILFIKFIQL
jgi:hypothetical protein